MALPLPKSHGSAVKYHLGISSAVFSTCTILEILPAVKVDNATAGSALCSGRDMEDVSGMLGHKRPIIVMLLGLFICLWVSGKPSPSQVSLFRHLPSYTELTVLWGTTEGWHKVTACDLIRAPGVSALFCFITFSAAISFELVDDFHLFPREQWSIFDLPAPNQHF